MEEAAAAGPTLADYAAAEAAGYGYETPAGNGTPAKALPPGESPGSEDAESTADLLSPGGRACLPANAGLLLLLVPLRCCCIGLDACPMPPIPAFSTPCLQPHPLRAPPCRRAGLAAGHPPRRRPAQRSLLLWQRRGDAVQPRLERR